MSKNTHQLQDFKENISPPQKEQNITLPHTIDIDDLPFYVHNKKNILICGGTSSGKTSFLNVLLDAIPNHERIITLEDTREIELNHNNVLHLIAPETSTSQLQLTIEHLLKLCLRLRPDRIILGEIRGEEAMSFIQVLLSGHPGSLATIHASSPHQALQRLALLATQNYNHLPFQGAYDLVLNAIDIVIHLEKSGSQKKVTEIFCVPKNTD